MIAIVAITINNKKIVDVVIIIIIYTQSLSP